MEKDPTRTPRHVVSFERGCTLGRQVIRTWIWQHIWSVWQSAWVGLASNWISSFPSSLFASFGPIEGSIWMSWGTISWIALVMSLYQVSAFSWVNTLIIVGNGENRFTRVSVFFLLSSPETLLDKSWSSSTLCSSNTKPTKSSDVAWMLGQAQHAVQETISNITQHVIDSGISSKDGLASINRDGIFLSGLPVINQNVVQKEFERSLKLKTLIKIWRVQVRYHHTNSSPSSSPLHGATRFWDNLDWLSGVWHSIWCISIVFLFLLRTLSLCGEV